jgi:hypothetical protein
MPWYSASVFRAGGENTNVMGVPPPGVCTFALNRMVARVKLPDGGVPVRIPAT